MTTSTSEEIFQNFLAAAKAVDDATMHSSRVDKYASMFYFFNPALQGYWSQLESFLSTKITPALTKQLGNLMEQIAWLAVDGLRGITTIESFQSAGPQYDLLATGDGPEWGELSRYVYMRQGGSFVVEAKTEKKPIGDPEFARMCGLLANSLVCHGQVGIFFTLNGASGIPRSATRSTTKPQRTLRDCQLRQVRFRDQTGKPIIVFDQEDVRALSNGENFALMIRQKIRAIDEQPGSDAPSINNLAQCRLPPHLDKLSNFARKRS